MAEKTPTEIAVELWGQKEGHSRSAGARKVRIVARDMYGHAPTEDGRKWYFTDAQAAAICNRLTGAYLG